MKVLSLKPRIGKRSFLSLKLYIEHEIKAILGKETLWSLFPKGTCSICLEKKKSEIIFRLLKFLTVITLEIYVYMYLLLFTPYAWNV